MKRMKQLGWIMGASLLTIGGGVTASLVTTSCSNNDDKELGLTFDLKATQIPPLPPTPSTFNDDPTIVGYVVLGTVNGLKTDQTCMFVTTKDGKEPNNSEDPATSNVWTPPADGSTDSYTQGVLASYTDQDSGMVGAMGYEAKDVDSQITIDNVYATKMQKGTKHGDWYKISITLTVIPFPTPSIPPDITITK